jgi:hypothetical protein
MIKPSGLLGHWNESGAPRTAEVLRFFRVRQEDLEIWVKTAALLSTDGEQIDQEDAARTKVFNAFLILVNHDGVRFSTEGVARNYWDSRSELFSCGTVTCKRAMELGLLDEVLEKLKAIELLK